MDFFKKGKLNDFSAFFVPSVHKQEKNKVLITKMLLILMEEITS